MNKEEPNWYKEDEYVCGIFRLVEEDEESFKDTDPIIKWYQKHIQPILNKLQEHMNNVNVTIHYQIWQDMWAEYWIEVFVNAGIPEEQFMKLVGTPRGDFVRIEKFIHPDAEKIWNKININIKKLNKFKQNKQ